VVFCTAFDQFAVDAFELHAIEGGAVHMRAGRVFFYCTCAIALSGFGMAALILAEPRS
jgi:hypothetical protein